MLFVEEVGSWIELTSPSLFCEDSRVWCVLQSVGFCTVLQIQQVKPFTAPTWGKKHVNGIICVNKLWSMLKVCLSAQVCGAQSWRLLFQFNCTKLNILNCILLKIGLIRQNDDQLLLVDKPRHTLHCLRRDIPLPYQLKKCMIYEHVEASSYLA